MYVQNAVEHCWFHFYLDPFLIAASLDDSVDIDTGDVDVLCSKSPHVHHLLNLHGDAERWAPPSPVTRLTTLQIAAQITARADETTLPENNLCRRKCEIQHTNRWDFFFPLLFFSSFCWLTARCYCRLSSSEHQRCNGMFVLQIGFCRFKIYIAFKSPRRERLNICRRCLQLHFQR